MRFMNDFDIARALDRFEALDRVTPNRHRAAATLARLADWADRNSDGWVYWPKPARAAAKLMTLVDGATWADLQRLENTDATDAELTAALRPIKAFLTRQGVDHADVIPPA